MSDTKTICWNCGSPIDSEAEKCEACELEQSCTGGCGDLLDEAAREAGRDVCFSCAVENA